MARSYKEVNILYYKLEKNIGSGNKTLLSDLRNGENTKQTENFFKTNQKSPALPRYVSQEELNS
jgi:hypothetical protein